MPQPGSIIGDFVETVREQGGKIAKEVARAPVDIVKAGFEQPIPNPTPERKQQLEAERQAKLAKTRTGLAMEQEMRTAPPQQEHHQQGAEIVEKGKINQNAMMNNAGSTQLSASMTPKKKMSQEPVVVQGKRNNKLHGAG